MYTISATLIKWLVRGHANHLLRQMVGNCLYY